MFAYREDKCTNCGSPIPEGTGWVLNGYHKLSGRFCRECFELVSHTPYGVPRHPQQYITIAVKQALLRNSCD